MSPFLNAVSVSAFDCGEIEMSPPCAVSVASPCEASQLLSATSWVPPSCGLATVLPLRSAALWMSFDTTKNAPPEVVPEMIRMAAPEDLA